MNNFLKMTNIKAIFMSSKNATLTGHSGGGGGVALINWSEGEAETKAFT